MNACNFKAAAINTVSGVSMTTRKQMLKIKVGTYLAVPSNYLHNSGSHQGMSEAKVEKIKVGEDSSHICSSHCSYVHRRRRTK